MVHVMLMRVLGNIPLLLRLLLKRDPLTVREAHIGNSHTIAIDGGVDIFDFSTVVSTHVDRFDSLMVCLFVVYIMKRKEAKEKSRVGSFIVFSTR